MMIQMALKWAPKTTSNVASSQRRGPRRLPPKEHQPQEAALQEEGKDALSCQQAAKDVAHEARVIGPVGAKLELLHQAGGHAQGKDQAIDLDPEEGELPPFWIFGADIDDADHDQKQAQPDGNWRIDKVEAGRESELQTRKQFGIHADAPFRVTAENRRPSSIICPPNAHCQRFGVLHFCRPHTRKITRPGMSQTKASTLRETLFHCSLDTQVMYDVILSASTATVNHQSSSRELLRTSG